MAKSFVGIDIGSKSIKAVEIELKGGRKILKAVGEIAVPVNMVSAMSESAIESLSLYLKKLIEDSGIKSRLTICSYPSEKASIDIIDLPIMPESELSQAMKWQLKKYVNGYPDDKAAFWDILDREMKYRIMIVGTDKTAILKYISLIEKSGLKPQSLEIEPVALVKSLVKDQDNFIIVHIDSSFTSFSLIENGQLSLTRNLRIGTLKLIEAINQTEKDLISSEKLLFEIGLLKIKDRKIYSSVEPWVSQIAAELKRLVAFFEEQSNQDKEIKKVILSGEGANIPDIDNYFIKSASKEIIMANPWTGLEISSSIDAEQLVPLGPKFAVAIGLVIA